MTLHIEQDYAEKVFIFLPMFKKSVGKFSLVARCPICGDSKKDEYMARFRAYEYKDRIRVGCFNCNYNATIVTFMKDHRADLYREFIVEAYKPQHKAKEQPVYKTKAVIAYVENELDHCVRLDKLSENHPIIKYVSNRKIPKNKYNRLFFTTDWASVANSIKENSYPPESRKEPRLVIPIYNEKGKIESVQGRSLNPKAKSKYITIKHIEESTKIYGMDLIDKEKPVFVMEGCIDTLFIENSIAITGGQMSIDEIPYENAVFVLDNENRHPDTMRRYEYYINNGAKVVLWDRSNWSESDVNDMIVKEGATPEEISDYLNKNIVQGLMAELRFNKWKMV